MPLMRRGSKVPLPAIRHWSVAVAAHPRGRRHGAHDNGAAQYLEVRMTEDEYPLRLAAATGNPRCVAQIHLIRDISEEEGIRPRISSGISASCPFEAVPGTDLCVRHLNGEKIPGELG